MKNIILIFCFLCFDSCTHNTDSKIKNIYTTKDILVLNGHKFSKQEFNHIVDNFPRLYQDDVLHPDSLYNSEFTNPHFGEAFGQNIALNSVVGKNQYFALYANFLAIKNKGTRFEYLRNHLKDTYETINTIFEELNSDSTFFAHQYSRISAYVEFDIHFINNSTRQPKFTKITRSERWEFIDDLKKQISIKSKMANMKPEEEKIINALVDKLNEAIVNDYVLYKAQRIVKAYLNEFNKKQK